MSKNGLRWPWVIAIASLSAATVAGAFAAALVRFARLVVTPSRKKAAVRIVRADLATGELIMQATKETLSPGKYGLWFGHESGFARIADVAAVHGGHVYRHIDEVISGLIDRATHGEPTAWYFAGPWELDLPYEDVSIRTDLGGAPAWAIPVEDPRRWVIQIHGRGSQREEGLRAVQTVHSVGWNSLLISYRNDADAPASIDGRYGLGSTEWRDVEAAVDYVRSRGAENIVLMGWSMGGAIALQTVLRCPELRGLVVGLVLESPAIDWVEILRFQGTEIGVPAGMGDLVAGVLGNRLGARLAGIKAPINIAELDAAARASELKLPILLMHSEADGFVPISGSRRLAAARPDLVQFEVFEKARHTALWNYSPERWSRVLRQWLQNSVWDGVR